MTLKMGESLKLVFVHLIKPNESTIFLLWLFLLKPIKVMSQVDHYNQNSVFMTQVKVLVYPLGESQFRPTRSLGGWGLECWGEGGAALEHSPMEWNPVTFLMYQSILYYFRGAQWWYHLVWVLIVTLFLWQNSCASPKLTMSAISPLQITVIFCWINECIIQLLNWGK